MQGTKLAGEEKTECKTIYINICTFLIQKIYNNREKDT